MHDDSLKAVPVQSSLSIFCGYLPFCAGMPLRLFQVKAERCPFYSAAYFMFCMCMFCICIWLRGRQGSCDDPGPLWTNSFEFIILVHTYFIFDFSNSCCDCISIHILHATCTTPCIHPRVAQAFMLQILVVICPSE